ncbi:CRP/FNR family nitrogen fixation transcriptional regulator [Rhizobium sp. SORGH_AS 787]|nr:CRP/FNR family nitrogen fixation transcriptional regulator [Rhizobium sp. SORGH_AS_0787]
MVDLSETSIDPRGLAGVPMPEPAQLRSLAHLRRFHREQEIYRQEERSETWYRIVSGSARKYLISADGRRRLVDIFVPGDLFGFTSRLHHRFAVQAVADETLVACYPRQRVEALAKEDKETAVEINRHVFEALERMQEHLLVISTMTAKEKVREFLTYFHHRLSASDEDSLSLPITRYDIADMLGISAETVCRAFTDLQEHGVISLHGPRQIVINRTQVATRKP